MRWEDLTDVEFKEALNSSNPFLEKTPLSVAKVKS